MFTKFAKKSLLVMVFFLLSCFFNFRTVKAANISNKINQNDMIYFIMTDRFYDGDKTNDKEVNETSPSGYKGGDFQGIIDKLDYIKNLGFTAIWISPVVQNDANGYHGYWSTDFYKTNENFGSMEKLKELVKKAHEKGIKVIFDIVVNHTGQNHPWLKDPSKASWFHEKTDITDYNNQSNVENGWLAGLPDLNQENPEVKTYLIKMAKWWIKQTGIDGYRLDTVRHVPKDFWTDFVKEIKKDYPNFYFIGEVANSSQFYIQGYDKTGIDGFVDYPTYYAVNSVFGGSSSASSLVSVINNQDMYTNKNLMGTFIDNHDVPRFINGAKNLKTQRLKSALAFMMTYTGIPIMYYGTEIGMDGGNDPDNRREMDWSSKSPLTDYVKKLTSIRKSNKALTQGDIKILDSNDNYIAYSREYKGNTIISVFNTSDQPQKVEFNLPKGIHKLSFLKDLLSNKDFKIANGKVALTMEPMQSNILVCKSMLPYIVGAAGGIILAALLVIMFLIKKGFIFKSK